MRIAPVVDRLQPGGDVCLVVAGAAGEDRSVLDLGAEGRQIPGVRIADSHHVVMRVDDQSIWTGSGQLSQDDGDAIRCSIHDNPVEASADPFLDPMRHLLDRGSVADAATTRAKSDAESVGIAAAIRYPNVTLETGALVTRLDAGARWSDRGGGI